MKKQYIQIAKIILLSLSVFVLANVSPVKADDETCVTQYGGGVVCGSHTPETSHAPVNAALGDVNLSLVGGIFVLVGGLLYWKSRKIAL